MLIHLTPRRLARAPVRVAISGATALAILGAGGFMALPKAPDAVSEIEPSAVAVSTTAAPTSADLAPVRPAELTCLTKAVYYEARGESPEGQAAVAQVVLNRTRRPSYPANVCGVVFQGVKEGGCQFSFACDGAMRRPLEPAAWTRAREVASNALRGHIMREVGQAISFHAAALGLEGHRRIARIGGHVFFMPGAAAVKSGRPSRAVAGGQDVAPAAALIAADARDAAAPAPVVVATNAETAPMAPAP